MVQPERAPVDEVPIVQCLPIALFLSLVACSSDGGGTTADAVGPYAWGEPAAARRAEAGDEGTTPVLVAEREAPSAAGSREVEVEAPVASLEPTGEPDFAGFLPAGIGPEAPDQWKIIPPKRTDWADTFSLQRPTEGLRIEDTIVQASPRTAIILYEHKGPYEDVVIEDSILRVEPGTLPLDRSYWGLRGYDVIDMLLRRVEITGFGKVTDKHDEGHAIYLNLRGSLTLEGCDIHHNGGQGLQLVNRPAESNFPPGPAEGFIAVRDTRFLENGFNPDRGGFQVSIFGTGQDVRMNNVLIAAGYDRTTSYPDGATGGGLLIEAEAFREWGRKPVWWRPEEMPEDFVIPFTQGNVELVGVHVHHRAPNRPIVQIKGCQSLVVRECTFGEGRIELDSPSKPGRDCGRIVWQGNRGQAVVYVRGERMGPADHDFVIEAE